MLPTVRATLAWIGWTIAISTACSEKSSEVEVPDAAGLGGSALAGSAGLPGVTGGRAGDENTPSGPVRGCATIEPACRRLDH